MMKWFNLFYARLRALFRRESVLQDIEEELRIHVEMETDRNIERGMSPDEARAAARKSFGKVSRSVELSYDIRGGGWLEDLWQDLRYGARTLVKKPGVSLIAVFTLALGIGANTAIFSVVNAVLLRPLPYPESERLMQLGRAFAGSEVVSDLSPQKFAFLREHCQSFDAITATLDLGANVYLSDENQADYIRGLMVTAEFFRVLGVSPASGRGFTVEEDSPSGERVAILGDGFWRRRFAGDAGMIGKTVTLDEASYTVIGIMPPGFEYNGDKDVFLPTRLGRSNQNEGHNWKVIGRLKPSVTPAQARAELRPLLDRFNALYPGKADGREFFGAVNWRVNLASDVRELLWILLGAAALVLLIACANVANLQLMQLAARRKEMAIRQALGAGVGRLLRQLLTEGVVLGLVGGTAGVLLAIWGLRAMIAILPAGLLPRSGEIRLDGQVLVFALGASLLTGMIASLAPALQALLADVNQNLKEGLGQAGADLARGRLRSVLVVAEVALALMLTVGAGLLLRTFANLRGVAPGFETRNAVTFEIAARGKNYDSAEKMNELYRSALERFRALPGVESVAVTNKLPLDGWFNLPYRLAGEKNKFSGSAEFRLISPEYIRTMKMSTPRGRAFNEADTTGAEPVIVVNEAFVRKHFANVEPIGQSVYVCCERGGMALRRIVGVVNETKQRSLSLSAPSTVFIPLAQATEEMKGIMQQASFVVRTSGDPVTLGAAIRSEMRRLDPTLPLRKLRTLEQAVSLSVGPQRFNVSLLGLFAALGLALAAVGIYGVMSYGVAQRTHEIGLRMALGAQAGDALKLVLKQGMALASVGVAIGLLLSLALTRWLKTLLFGVSATDPLTFAALAFLLLLVALVACWIPARRATRVDPIIALRCE